MPGFSVGPRVVRLRTITPVVMRSMAGKVFRLEPTAATIASSLVNMARAANLPAIQEDAVVFDVIESETRVERVSLQGKQGQVMGWAGTVELLCNAPARWLLEVAARGLGLGGRVGFGFGRIQLEAL